ncbi:extensin family protein [Allorhizobium undicola]|uniref:extensin-like domain-containing protein n=1 Tax=Allorhizobium undicola TaxID=78527 RepID=UPI003D33494E
MGRTWVALALAGLCLAGAAQAQDALPRTGPKPETRPQDAPAPASTDKPLPAAGTPPVPDPADVPKPEPKPETRPETGPETQHETKPETAPAEPEKPEAPPPIMPEDEAAYQQCLIDLKAEGAIFEPRPRIDDGNGCGIDKPLEVTGVLPGVSLSPKAVLRCEAALELSRWVKTVVIPTADQALPDKGKLTGVKQATSYYCRNRNSATTGKLSEHARGNAIDIAALQFEKGTVPMKIVPDDEPTLPGAFQRTLNASACLYFTTVLAPGADETHEDHMHLDLIRRHGDYRVCQDGDHGETDAKPAPATK